MRSAFKNFLGVCVILITSFDSSYEVFGDWPEFRGPSAQGLVPASQPLPVTWSQTENVKWRTELPGQGWSSPVVIGKSIYLTTAIEKEPVDGKREYDLELLVVNADSGQLAKRVHLFTQKASAPGIHQKNSHASPTPICDGEHLYLHFGHQGIACTDLNGEVVWRNDKLSYPPVHGNGGSPVVFGNAIIFSRDGADISEVTALDKRTGEILWKRQRDVDASKKFSFATPLLIEVSGGKQLIFPGSNIVQSIAPETGEEIWRVSYDGYSVIPRPIYADGLLFICTGYDRPSMLAIDPTGSGDVTATHLQWKIDDSVPHTPSLVSLNSQILMISDKGIASSVDIKTGKQNWRERIGGNFSASPLLVGNRMYMLSEEGETTILEVGTEAKVLAKNKLGERCLASPAIVGNDLLIRSANALYRITESE